MHETRDSVAIQLLASCGSVGEAALARTMGMDGIGLYRTELLYLIDREQPSLDSLVAHYSAILEEALATYASRAAGGTVNTAARTSQATRGEVTLMASSFSVTQHTTAD